MKIMGKEMPMSETSHAVSGTARAQGVIEIQMDVVANVKTSINEIN
jgi:hypothetical protein